MTGNPARTVVVGAGVVGTAIAYELQKHGENVTLIDPLPEVGRGASYGNQASIAVSEFLPASRPAILTQIPRWLLDPKGPLAIKLSYMPRMIPWFWRFLLAARPSALARIETGGAALAKRALQDTMNLLRELDASDDLSDKGCLALYQTNAEYRADRDRITMLKKFGFDFQELNRSELSDLEPALLPDICRAVLLPDSRSLKDPHHFVVQIAERFKALGGTIMQANVTGFERSETVTAVLTDKAEHVACNQVILCAGVQTAALARMLGEAIPLETERGYHTQIADPDVVPNHSLIWPTRAFMITPTANGLRVGGTVEMAGLHAPPDMRRADIILQHAQEALPGLNPIKTTQWMGHRPALPDTLPVISASAKTAGVFYATGHGHLGLTYAATTAILMRQLTRAERPIVDPELYSIRRF